MAAPPVLPKAPESAEQRAVAFLATHVVRWAPENKCFSCHNNGDAARALFVAAKLGVRFDPRALAETTDWLAHPQRWKHNRGDDAASDKKLAAIQFASATECAISTGALNDKSPLLAAARIVSRDQHADGSWKVGAAGIVGSPATYGTALATVTSRHVLIAADPKRFEKEIRAADRWLRALRPRTVLDAAAVYWALARSSDEQALAGRRHCLSIIEKGQSDSGGWGPYITSPPEPFDTAIVLLAFAASDDRAQHQAMIDRGRAYLIGAQLPDGSWPETTRPAGAESYAQRLSTAGWAALALLRIR